ncbi:MAG: hypothetical protein AAF664_06915 [Planctomycetota bacterium]
MSITRSFRKLTITIAMMALATPAFGDDSQGAPLQGEPLTLSTSTSQVSESSKKQMVAQLRLERGIRRARHREEILAIRAAAGYQPLRPTMNAIPMTGLVSPASAFHITYRVPVYYTP